MAAFNEEIKRWESFLSKNSKRYLRIENADTLEFVKGGGAENPSWFFLDDVLRSHASVAEWVDSVIQDNDISRATVYFRQKSAQGEGRVPGYSDETFDVSARLAMLSMKGAKTPVLEHHRGPASGGYQGAVQHPTSQNHNTMNQNHHSNGNAYPVPYGMGAAIMQSGGGLMSAAAAAGLGLPEFIDLKKKADRADEYKEERDKLRIENEKLIIDNRQLTSDKETAEKEKTLALLESKLERQSFFESPGFQKLVETAGPALAAVLSKAGGQNSAGGVGAPGDGTASEAKRSLITYILDPAVDDQLARTLEYIIALASSNNEFITEINQVIQKHHG
ncbi:hypothetical protein [Robiginitalea biformata]|uniref:Uncharacterized protein n=1 Tax=Robiginitalea biformata (strain ATCC BAA-864 / DSM 15991 / KCTC 12146 / HTCC2501) TaxID=313596 RepID=A4CKN6_ROBBH|nr:hypothetical protein [Robiginitalea biformata]EAR15435.1 hypothetical protein RB2501_13944 [Robiginitalea biformata HTCC2501]